MSDDDEEWWGEGLQVELFHAQTERKPGDRNFEGLGFDLHPEVFVVSAALIAAFILLTLSFQTAAAEAFGTIQSTITAYGSWFYIIAANVFVVFVVALAVSKYGEIRIGGVHASPEFSDFSWVSMLFSAGMGIGLMLWSVAEPVVHFTGGSTRGRSTASSLSGWPFSRSIGGCR
jgi:choline/glycine/proline betaine transport protein